ncbi:MAG: hypothetical protein US16_C0003G0065 [Candidatus Moranbacteria bacterium GW2011_GWE2_36_40]|nr:MAG: hypothetical protein US16_C0003G0065 [Candidatus Moranbacteria bacterium GW2011_GWE2_36_40]
MKNVGILDKSVRVIFVLVFLVIGSLYADGFLRLALYVLALALSISVVTSFCFLYKFFDISTNNKK